MISVIIPTYRNPKYLEVCLRSLLENKTMKETEVIVVVDGFFEESEAVLDKFKGISVLPLEQNMGMQYAINLGVMQATNPYVFVVNDDNVFPVQWDIRLASQIDLLQKTSYTDGDRWVMTVNQIEPTGPSMFNFHTLDLGRDVDTFQYERFLDEEPKFALNFIEATGGGIFPFLIEKKWYMAVGGMDTFYDSPNICDWDFFLKLELLSFRFLRTHNLNLYHFGSVSTKKNAERSDFVQRESAAASTYFWKWGAAPSNTPGTNSKLPYDKRFRGFKV